VHVVDPEPAGDQPGRGGVVAGHHHRPQTVFAHRRERLDGVRAHFVAEGDDAQRLAVLRYRDDGPAGLFELGDARLQGCEVDPAVGEQAGPADQDRPAGDDGGDPEAGDRVELVGGGDGEAAVTGGVDDGAGQRMLGVGLGGGGDGQQLGFVVHGPDLADRRTALGEGAGLVQHDVG